MFTLRTSCGTKTRANERAEELRRNGHRARIVYEKGSGRYRIYSRGDRKRKIKSGKK